MRRHALVLLLAISAATACFSTGGSTDPGPTPTPTVPADVNYYRDVAPIVNANCVGCHVGGGIGPFELGTYAQAYAYGSLIKGATSTRTMPPQPIDASGACQTFEDARWMTDYEIALVGA